MRHLLPVGLLLFVCASSAHADSLYRCVARNGAVSYQSQVCAAQQRLDRVVEYQPEPVATRAVQAPATSRRQPRAGTRSGGARSTRPHRVTTAGQRCRAGKAQREAALQRLGLKRTYDQLSRLDAAVRAACVGY